MNHSLTQGQVCVLHSLRDGDDPLMRAPDADLIFLTRDLGFLMEIGLIQLDGKAHSLTDRGREIVEAVPSE